MVKQTDVEPRSSSKLVVRWYDPIHINARIPQRLTIPHCNRVKRSLQPFLWLMIMSKKPEDMQYATAGYA